MDQNNTPKAPSVGYLAMRVRTAGDALPVKGARVTVLSAQDGGEIAVLFTDSSGNTPPLALPAPDASASLTPGGGTVSFLYHTITDAEGYYSAQNLFLPVYAGVTSIQTVQLVPFPDIGQTPPYPSDITRFNESQSPDL